MVAATAATRGVPDPSLNPFGLLPYRPCCWGRGGELVVGARTAARGSGPSFSAPHSLWFLLLCGSLQFKSLELFARFAYNTVTEDAFTCKSKKVAAFPKGLEVRPSEPLRTRIARTHPSPLSHQQASMILCGRPRCDASRKPFSQHPPVQAVPLLRARCGGPYAQPTRSRLSARPLAAGGVTEFTCSVNTHSRPASASVLRWNGTARLLPLATITGLAYLIIFTMTGMHALQ